MGAFPFLRHFQLWLNSLRASSTLGHRRAAARVTTIFKTAQPCTKGSNSSCVILARLTYTYTARFLDHTLEPDRKHKQHIPADTWAVLTRHSCCHGRAWTAQVSSPTPQPTTQHQTITKICTTVKLGPVPPDFTRRTHNPSICLVFLISCVLISVTICSLIFLV